MNADRHAHDLQFKEWPYNTSTSRTKPDVVYGDQKKKWPSHGPFLEARRRRSVRRIIERHDRESIKAGVQTVAKQTTQEQYKALAESIAGSGWR